MLRKKVLFVTEASFHATGYSVYTKEVLSRLNKIPELEVAELACYANEDSPEIKDIPWKFYANAPNQKNNEEVAYYNNSMSAKFGELKFNHVLLEFQPDFVMDIRDWWMLEFEERSPFREFFNWAIMPTVDAAPQNQLWIDTYSDADAVFSYSEFGRDTMLDQSSKIKFVNVASPCASEVFDKVADKKSFKQSHGIDPDSIIFGTVMRNQRRKLYPDLFKAFRLFLDQNPKLTNCYLYCHTGYPDVGWDIPSLIQENELANKVLLTYKCRKCGHVYPSFFHDCVAFCNNCKTFSSTLVSINNKIKESELNNVYNLFDVYIQWANSEGWGMPQLEAAYAGLPVVSINYSAMESLIANIKGVPVDPISYYKELETGCMRAVPDNKKLAEVIATLATDTQKRNYIADRCYSTSRKVYNWDYTAKKWADYFLNTPVKSFNETWGSAARMFNPAKSLPENINQISPSEQVSWLFTNVLGKPQLINGAMWKRIVRDLTYGITASSHVPGYYSNDFSMPDSEKRIEEFNISKAFEMLYNSRMQLNHWENVRLEKVNKS
jgi:glycosyltransferase involved in cell wall biosynthesis